MSSSPAQSLVSGYCRGENFKIPKETAPKKRRAPLQNLGPPSSTHDGSPLGILGSNQSSLSIASGAQSIVSQAEHSVIRSTFGARRSEPFLAGYSRTKLRYNYNLDQLERWAIELESKDRDRLVVDLRRNKARTK